MIEFKNFKAKTSTRNIPDLTPLIDMVFLLLIFFLLTSYLSRPAVTVTLPEADNIETLQETGLIVVINSDGSLNVNEKIISEDELSALLLAHVNNRVEGQNELIIQADRGVPFERVIKVMDISRNKGIFNISFLVEKGENE